MKQSTIEALIMTSHLLLSTNDVGAAWRKRSAAPVHITVII